MQKVYQLQNGVAVPTDFYADANGNLVRIPGSGAQFPRVPLQAALAGGFLVNGANGNSVSGRWVPARAGGNAGMNKGAFGQAKVTGEDLNVAIRTETNGTIKEANAITITATAGASAQKFILGDGAGLLGVALSVTSSNYSGTTFSGTYGNTPVTRMNALSFMGLHLSSLVVTVSDATMFTDTLLQPYNANVQGQSVPAGIIPWSQWKSPQDYSQLILRNDDFSFLINSVSGLLVQIGATQTITLSFGVKSWGAAPNMVR